MQEGENVRGDGGWGWSRRPLAVASEKIAVVAEKDSTVDTGIGRLAREWSKAKPGIPKMSGVANTGVEYPGIVDPTV